MERKNIIFKNGIYLGAVSVVLGVCLYVSGQTYTKNMALGMLSTVISFAASVLFIVLAIKAVKALNGGFLTLSEALKTGVGVALIGAIIGAIYTVVFTTVIEPNFYTKMLDIQREVMVETNPNLTQEQLDQALMISSKLSSPWFVIATSIMSGLFSGLIISLVAGAVMQKKQPIDFQ